MVVGVLTTNGPAIPFNICPIWAKMVEYGLKIVILRMMEPADIIIADKVINFLHDTFVVMIGSNGAIMMKHICA